MKRLRDERGVKDRPSAEAFEIYRLKQLGWSVPRIAEKFEQRWPECRDRRALGREADPQQTRERRVKRCLQQVREYLDRAQEREAASLTPRQRAILEALQDAPPVEPAE
jgi:hypothetical protein